MDYRSIMVCLDDSAHAAARLDYALDCARRGNACLTAVHVSGVPATSWAMGAEILIGPVSEVLREAQAAARERFRKASERAGVNAEFIAMTDAEVATALRIARTADLVIAGPYAAGLAASVGASLAAPLLLGAGRPVLFLPLQADAVAPFRSILVAWNDSRESARAVGDALPLLEAAEHVAVVSMQRLDGSAPDYRESGRRLVAGLGRHGVQAVFTAIDLEGDGLAVDEWLCRQTRDPAVDLLVTGGYGHGRMAERVLGGVTRTLLHQMAGPVLMSH